MKSLKVGIFAIIALGGFAFMSSKISNKGGFWVPYKTYKTHLLDADGIFERSKIRVAGINAGYIEKIQLDGSRALVIFKVKKKVVVTDKTSLKVKTVGFLGEKFLDLVKTGMVGEPLPENSFVKTEEAKGIDQLTETAGDSLSDVSVLLSKLREAVDNDKTDNALKDIVLNMKDAMGAINQIARQNSEALTKMVHNMEKITSGLALQFDQSKPDALINKSGDLGKIIDNLKSATGSFNEVVSGINKGEGTIGKVLKDDTIHDSVAETLTNVKKLVNKINTLEADISMYKSKNVTLGLDSTDFNLDLFPSPERFYRFGVTQNNFGPDGATNKIKTTTINGVTTEEKTREVDEFPYKLNIQFGRVFQRYVFRIGLIESTGGFGFDYLLSDYLGTKLTFEAFDFTNSSGSNIRLGLSFRVWNVLYARITGEDLLNNSRSLTIGAGLKFTDEDLSSLLGLAARAM